MLDTAMLEEIQRVVRELLAQEFAEIRASLDRMERMMDRNHLATVAKLDRLAASLRMDLSTRAQSGTGAVADPRVLERLFAIERELASWRTAGS